VLVGLPIQQISNRIFDHDLSLVSFVLSRAMWNAADVGLGVGGIPGPISPLTNQKHAWIMDGRSMNMFAEKN
jgi:hypothetical protein